MIGGAAALSAFLEKRRRLFVLTGAGCSTASGIPAYRDRGGQWTHRRPMSFAEFVASPAARRRYWEGSLRGWPRVRDARPNAAHAALARLEAEGRIRSLVTQNVDGLHRRAGSRRLIELHGCLDHAECLSCGARVRREDLQTLLLAWNPGAAPIGSFEDVPGPRPDGDAAVRDPSRDLRVPDCGECGGVLKPTVVFFGESVPRARVAEALAALGEADGVLVVGSSLMVYSAYRFVRAARAKGLEVAALTLGRTRADGELTLKVELDCALALQSIVSEPSAVHPS